MSSMMISLIVVWGLMAIAVMALIVWRKNVARNEDDQLHVLQSGPVAQQAAVAHKLEVIDRWGKIVTAVTVIYGVLLAALYVYQIWVAGSTTVQGS
jgi:hypothetical protein